LRDFFAHGAAFRRHVIGLGIGAVGASWLRPAAAAEEATEAHGMSAFGDLKYPVTFTILTTSMSARPRAACFDHPLRPRL